MDKRLALPNIDFADSNYKSLNFSENDILTIYMTSWDEKPFRIIFTNTIQFSYKVSDVPQDLYQSLKIDDAFFNEALLKYYEKIPLDHPYKLYDLEDIDNFPFIQVVAESVNVIKD